MSVVEPVSKAHDFFYKENQASQNKKKSFENQKVLDVVLSRVHSLEEEFGALLPTACSPNVVLSNIIKKKKKDLGQPKDPKPVGIFGDPNKSGFNACLQLIAVLPSLNIWVDFLPKNYEPLKAFIESYLDCFKKSKECCFCDNLAIKYQFGQNDFSLFFENLKENIPSPLHFPFFYDEIAPLDFKECFLFSDTPGKEKKKTFVCCNGQFFELDAFIEERVVQGDERSYLCYLKIGNKWFQCENRRVKPFASNYVSIALQTAVLLHYKKIQFSFCSILR